MGNKYKYNFSAKEREESILKMKLTIGFIGCVCFFYVMRQCNNFVLIGLDFILKVYTVAGLVFTILLYKIDKEYEKKDYELIFIYFQKFFTYGSIFLASFIFTNEYLSDNKEYEVTTLILEKKESHGRSSNSISVNIDGLKTEININDYSFDEIDKSKFAAIRLRNGYWNKLLIIDTKLIE
ncbi:hypothetical protein Q1W71_04170 [Flavobacterium pectinovorum]|uniref:hypothetical protein n=1 Tax=Flavobacterium pectinovorum TaxID=29533 RepID=UPI00265DF1E9|nr:hypothetical protein [Flavobacterium pectinovorum]WKL48983.1 hypothetical protein Q1W71_04170 [Flavobacterium pectinovorum]